MKTKVIFLCVVICMAFSIYSYTLQNKESALSALTLMNVEALAHDEHTNTVLCVSTGSVDCPNNHVKVEYYK